MFKRLILGTANFAKPYNGVQAANVDGILDYAQKKGVWAIDTATAYGTHHLDYPKKIVKIQKDDVLFGAPPLVIMAHNVEAFERAIALCNEKGSHLGASLYPDDVEAIQEYAYRPRVIQLPYSVMDRRMETYLPSIKAAGIQVHARSILCGGTVLEKTDPFKALMFVLANQYIDKVVIGTDSLQMLQDTLEPLIELDSLKTEDEAIIDLRRRI